MNIQLCIAWFIFGFIVGQMVLIAIALIVNDSRIEREKENAENKRVSEQGNNNYNKDKQ